jgi:copper chaperone CopZ
MTNIDVEFRYTSHPSEDTVRAVAAISEVYGIRGVRLNPAARSVRVEYDATRLGPATVLQLLRRAGLSVLAPEPPVPPAPPTATTPGTP